MFDRNSLLLIHSLFTGSASTTKTFWAKKVCITGPVAVRSTFMLCVAAWRERLLALGAAQARPVPVLAHATQFLGKVDFLVAVRTLRHCYS